MDETNLQTPNFDKTNPQSIFDFSRLLIGKSLHDLFGEMAVEARRKGKGGLRQSVVPR